MSSITSGTGIFSGINTSQIIDQLLAAAGRPKTAAQKRVVQLQAVQTAYLDINTRLGALKSAAAKFASAKTFLSSVGTASDPAVLGITADAGAAVGSFSITVDRLVSTQQLLSKGFTDKDVSGLGLTNVSFEDVRGRIDRDTALSQLNGGEGIARGKIIVTDSAGTATTVDLSRAETLGEVLKAITTATGGKVSAAAEGDHLKLTDSAGGAGKLTITNGQGFTTADSLGISGQADIVGTGGKIVGAQINRAGAGTALADLNDGLGVQVSNAAGTSTPDFIITTRDGVQHAIDVGDIYSDAGSGAFTKTASAVTDLGGVLARINSQSGGAVTASFSPDGKGIRLTDNTTPSGGSPTFAITDYSGRTTAKDLGILTSTSAATIDSRRLIAGLNSTLTRNIAGGVGLAAGAVHVRDRAGVDFAVTLATDGSIADLFESFSDQTGGRVTLGLNANGTGFVVTDTTGSTGSLLVDGAAATSLGIATGASGVDADTFNGVSAQHKYVGAAQSVSTLNYGKGIGTGTIEIIDSLGNKTKVIIGDSVKTVADLVSQIQSASPNILVKINDHGDGIIIQEAAAIAGTGGNKISIRDTSGTVAKSLGIAGTAAATGSANSVDGSFERTVAFSPADTLKQVQDKIDAANVAVSAGISNDGAGTRPFRLLLAAKSTGAVGRVIVDTGGVDLGLSTLTEGNNARAFYGSPDPARAILVSSPTNNITGVADGVTLNLKTVSTSPVTVTITRDSETIKKAVQDFVTAFNTVVDRIDGLSSYNAETKKRGTLLGDGTTQSLRQVLFATVNGSAKGISGRYQNLSQVGVNIDKDGNLKLDDTVFDAAFNTDAEAVASVFAARVQDTSTKTEVLEGQTGITVTNTDPASFTSQGVAELVAALADRYTGSIDGVLTRQRTGLDSQIKLQNDRMAQFDTRLASRRAVLESQFLAMERAIGSLQSQSGSLGQIKYLS